MNFLSVGNKQTNNQDLHKNWSPTGYLLISICLSESSGIPNARFHSLTANARRDLTATFVLPKLFEDGGIRDITRSFSGILESPETCLG